MKYYHEHKTEKLAIVFHGSGADEMDLVPLVTELLPNHSILSIRGTITDRGTLRYFSWPINGVFDENEITQNAEQIYEFLQNWLTKYKSHTYIGYSNGANMIGALMQVYPEIVQHAVLLHPLQVYPHSKPLNARVILTYGAHDSMITPTQTIQYSKFLTKHGAQVTLREFESGHEITSIEIQTVRELLNRTTE